MARRVSLIMVSLLLKEFQGQPAKRDKPQIAQRIHRLKVSDLGVIAVTHDQEEARGFADRVAVMDQGVLLQTGTPQDVCDRPASVFVARLPAAPI